ncbi:MAG: hypothetical protein HY334_01205 [Armatimonadetes bacterium]|nr:hypothetical protein [Armatimonadota bacterium]
MTSIDAGEVLSRLRRLDHLVAAFGHILIASELDRPLPSVLPLLVADDLPEADAGGLVKEILRRGGADLVADLEELERLVRQAKKDAEVTAALRRVRLAFRHTARFHAGALARKLGRAAQAGIPSGPDAGSLQKELEAFISGVARAVRDGDGEIEEVFADEDLLTVDEEVEAAPSGEDDLRVSEPDPTGDASQVRPDEPEAVPDVAESFLYKDESALNYKDESALNGPLVSVDGAEPAKDDPPAPIAPTELASDEESADGEGAAWVAPLSEERPLDWLRDRVDVYNEMLARWGAGEAFVPEASPLVRRGMLTAERCAALYQDLLDWGAQRMIERFEELQAAPGEGDDRLRYVRSRIADGLATAVPRVLALLTSGEPLPADRDAVAGGQRRTLADLTAYLTRAVDLFDDASSQHARLSYLASELRTAARPAPI